MYGNCPVCGKRFGFQIKSCKHIKEQERQLKEFYNDLQKGKKEMPQEFNDILNKNFWDIIK